MCMFKCAPFQSIAYLCLNVCDYFICSGPYLVTQYYISRVYINPDIEQCDKFEEWYAHKHDFLYFSNVFLSTYDILTGRFASHGCIKKLVD